MPSSSNGKKPNSAVENTNRVYDVDRREYDLAWFMVEAVSPGVVPYGEPVVFGRGLPPLPGLPNQKPRYITTTYKLTTNNKLVTAPASLGDRVRANG